MYCIIWLFWKRQGTLGDNMRRPAKSDSKTAAAAVLDAPPLQPMEDPGREEPSSGRFPLPASSKLGSKALFSYLATLQPDHWDRVICYLYRSWPRIDRNLTGNDKNIEKIGEPFTEDDILKKWGEGDYLVRVNDSGRKNGSLCTAALKIRNTDYPPVLDLAELDLGHPDNRSYIDGLKARGIKLPNEKAAEVHATEATAAAGLVDVTRTLLRERNQPAAPTLESALVPKLIEIFGKANEHSIQMLVSQIKQNDPENLLKLVGTLKELMPADRGGSSEKMIELLLKVQMDGQKAMAEAQQRNFDLMLKFTERKDGGASSMLGQLRELKEFMGDMGGGGATKWDLFRTAIEAIPAAITQTSTLLAQIAEMKKAGVAVNPGEVVGHVAGSAGGRAAASIAAPSPTGGSMLQQAVAQFGGILINALDRGVPGDQIAASVDAMHGRLVYDQIIGMGKEGILRALQSSPQLWTRLQPIEAQLGVFIDEFISYSTAEEGTEQVQ